MNRTAQRIREIVLSRLSVYIRVCGDKNDEPCRTHAKKYLNSICLQIHTDHVTLPFEKKIFAKRMQITPHCPHNRSSDHRQNCTGCSLMPLTVQPWSKIPLNILFTKMNARSRKRTLFQCHRTHNTRK